MHRVLRSFTIVLSLALAFAPARIAAALEISLPDSGPFGAAVSPGGEVLLVPLFGTFTPWDPGTKVAVVDPATDTLLGTIEAGMQPEDVAFTPDGAYAFVTNSGDATVTVIHVASLTPVATTSVGTAFMTFPFGIAVSPDGREAWVATSGGNYDGSEENLVVLGADPARPDFGTVTGRMTITGGFTRPAFRKKHQLAVPRGFADNDFSANPQVAILNTREKTLESTISITPAPGGYHGAEDLATSPDGRYAYVPVFNFDPTQGSDEVYVVDLAENRLADIIDLGADDVAQHGIASSPDGLLVLVTNFYKGTVSWIFTPTHTVIAETPSGANPNEVAFTPSGGKAYVTNQESSSVSVYPVPSSADLVIGLAREAIASGRASTRAARDLEHRIAKLERAVGEGQSALANRVNELARAMRHHAGRGELTIGRAKDLFPTTADLNDVATPVSPTGVDSFDATLGPR